MSDKDRAQSACIIEIGLERENAEHQVEPAGHLLDAPAVPCPNLRADVINDLLRRNSPPHSTRQAQIKYGIINQDDGGRFVLFDLAQCFMKLLSEIAVMFDEFPEPEDAGLIDPIFEIPAGDGFHLWSAAPDEDKSAIGRTRRGENGRRIVRRPHQS